VKPAVLAAAGVGAATVGHFALAASSSRRLRNRFLPQLAGVGTPGHLALTFDDGPDPSSTPLFLDALDELGLKATFFMLGRMAACSPDLAAEVALRGHEVAVHGFQHSNHLRRGPRWTTRDMVAARSLLSELTGATPRFARPPYGVLAASTLRAAKTAGLQPVLWTTWGRDWRQEASADSVVRDVQATLVQGPTVLLHDSDCTSARGSWKATLAALPRLAHMWQAAGLTVGTLAEHGLAEHGLAEHGLAEHGLAEHGLAEHGLAEHGLALK